MKKAFIWLLFILLFGCSGVLKAQDAHYWSSNFGPAGFLTPGAAVANTLDSGIVYFNPAIMAWSKKTATSISSNLYRYDRIFIRDGVGQGKNLIANSTKIIPQMVSRTFKLNPSDPLTIGIALIQNPVQDVKTSQRMDKTINVLNDSYSPGPEIYIGQYDLQSKVTETYAQLSAGKKISQKLAVGLTMEGTIRRQVVTNNTSSKAIFNTPSTPEQPFPPIAANETYYQTDYTHIGVRFKLGVSYDSGRHHWGALLSSPIVKLYSDGSVVSDLTFNNIVIPGTTVPINLLASTRQTGLKASWKMPLSLAGAYAYDYGKGQVYIAAELFATVKPYTILKADDALFVRNTEVANRVNTGSLNLNDGRNQVLNFGVGYSRQMSKMFSMMASFRTDFNYLNTRDDEQGHVALWDNYHFQLGGNFKRRKLNLRAGLMLTTGKTDGYTQPVNFDNPTENNFLMGDSRQVQAKHFTVGLLLAYIHNF